MASSESDRLVRWVNASQIGTGHADPAAEWLVMRIQLAGGLDARLRERDAWYGDIEQRHQRYTVDLGVSEYLHTSMLWVLDVFEIVRTIGSLVRRRALVLPSEADASLRQLRAHLAELRAPLAKYEAAGRPTVRIVPYPVLVSGVGAAWNVGELAPTIVSRQTLGDEFLAFLETAAEARG